MRNETRSGLLAATLSACLLAGGMAQGQSPAFVKETAANLPGYNIWRPADLARRSTPSPVVVWANGGCAPADFTWATLFERWASEGYVVVTINEAGAPTQRPAAAPPATAGAAPQAGRAGPMTGPGSQAAATAAKQGKAIDWAEKESVLRGGAYAGKLDLARVVAAGNSCGGISSLSLVSTDKRPKSVFVLSGSSAGPGAQKPAVDAIMGKVTAPTIWIVGGLEDVARAAADMDYAALPAGVPAVVVQRVSADHRTVSTDKAILADVAEMGLAWFRASLYGDAGAVAAVTATGCAKCDPKTWTGKSKNLTARR